MVLVPSCVPHALVGVVQNHPTMQIMVQPYSKLLHYKINWMQAH